MTTSYRLSLLSFVLALGCSRTDASEHADHERMPSMDKRTPLPLTEMMANHQKEQMRDHLRVVQEIAASLAVEDYDASARSASRISWSTQQAAMCKHMGAGAPGFADVGEQFHRAADKIMDAARTHDRVGVAAALGSTLTNCTGCHDTYRQEIVDEASFEKLAGSSSEACPMHGK